MNDQPMIKVATKGEVLELPKFEAISLWESQMMTINNTLPYLRAMVLDPNQNGVEKVDTLELIEHHTRELARLEALIKEAKKS